MGSLAIWVRYVQSTKHRQLIIDETNWSHGSIASSIRSLSQVSQLQTGAQSPSIFQPWTKKWFCIVSPKKQFCPITAVYITLLEWRSRGGWHTSNMEYTDTWRPTYGFFNHSPRFRPICQDKTGGNGAIVVLEEHLEQNLDGDTRRIVVKRVPRDSSGAALEKETQYLEVRTHNYFCWVDELTGLVETEMGKTYCQHHCRETQPCRISWHLCAWYRVTGPSGR